MTVVILDQNEVAALLHSVSRVTVLVRRVHAEWDRPNPKDVTYQDRLFFWINSALAGTQQPPGNLSLSLGNEATINGEVKETALRLIKEFYIRIAGSPNSGMTFLEEQEKARERALATMNEFRAEIAAANRNFGRKAHCAWRPLIVAKCYAIIVWKSLGLVANGVNLHDLDELDYVDTVKRRW